MDQQTRIEVLEKRVHRLTVAIVAGFAFVIGAVLAGAGTPASQGASGASGEFPIGVSAPAGGFVVVPTRQGRYERVTETSRLENIRWR